MLGNILPILLILFTQFVSIAFSKNINTNSTSYISIRTKDKVDYRLSSTLDLLNHATLDQPVIVFEFEKFKIIDSMINNNNQDETNMQFLSQFFENHVTNILNSESNLERPSIDLQLAFFKIKDIEQSGSSILYDYPVEDYSVFWFKFQKKNYKISEVNDFIESACIFLEEYLNINIDILINSKDTVSLEDLDAAVTKNKKNNNYNYNDSASDSDSDSNNDNKKQKEQKQDNTENDNSLSKIWTEGLIMCLIVSFLLLGILIVALSWIMSIEISYTALEKPTNPIKKTQ